MKLYAKAYLQYLKSAAVGIPAAPFRSFLWSGFGEALRELADTLATFILCLVTLATYPVAVFIVAAVACERDRRAELKHAQWLKEMSRGDCIDWTE